jgi:hypothetical protein
MREIDVVKPEIQWKFLGIKGQMSQDRRKNSGEILNRKMKKFGENCRRLMTSCKSSFD